MGVGGASQFASAPGLGQAGASDLNLRFGYGFSDRFQLFVDLDVQEAVYADRVVSSNRTLMLRGQTVLLGDRSGNGLNLNGGVGFGGFTTDLQSGARGDPYGAPCGYCRGFSRSYDDRLGFAVGGGLSFDARLGRYLALSPEFFATWHVVPNGRRQSDIATAVGLRLNLLWYLK